MSRASPRASERPTTTGRRANGETIDEHVDAPWFLAGNFGPVQDELTALDLDVTGAIPPALAGPVPAQRVEPGRRDGRPLVLR